ncbi:MAG TPA: tRNA (N(6)-L-threonylcarbamoyladenosine(37)-C(2))-methylthiotransferase [Methanomassiliicoccales archaeon]|nr:tRNA (N(6)-L-threonylcarbamoyladenosine(37)-C(2))-methylthiotransferase [Methanomassiliicoccales archaeon]
MKFIVETYGCTMNQGESAELAAYLGSLGHRQVFDENEADVALINTCVVIEPTERKILRRLRYLRDQGKKLLIVGCMASVGPERLREEFPEALISGTSDYPRFLKVLEEEFHSCGQAIEIGEQGQLVLPIAQGCNGSCSYCITKLARGDLVSYPLKGLVRRVEQALGQGAKEILVTSQDTAAYGMDGNDRLPDLLRAICDVPGDFRVRVGMMNPDNLAEILDGMVEAYRHPKVYRFLHLPVQSGSDRVIREMGRAYRSEEYLEMVRRLRSSLPELTLSTDVITGFPGETEEDHHRTVELMEQLRPNIINVTRFSRRQGTVADGMKGQVPGWVSKERSRELTRLRFRISSEINASKVGRVYSVLIDEKGKGSSVMARTDDYLPVVIKGDHELWRRVNVKITGHASTHLYGVIVPGMEN